MPERPQIDLAEFLDSQRSGWYQRSILIWSCLLMCIDGYDMQVISFAAPAIIKAWGIDKASFGPIFGAGLFGYMLGATLLSSLADRFGRKFTIISGALLFGALTLATAFAQSVGQLLTLRFIAGIGLGASVPTIVALNAEYVASSRRATRITVMFVGYTIGSAIAGIVSATWLPKFGWPILFYLGGFFPLIAGAVLMFVLPESIRFLVLKGGKQANAIAILRRLRPEVAIEPDSIIVLHEGHRAGLPVRHLFTDGRAAITSLLWITFVTSLLGHHFLTSWLPTVLVSAHVSIQNAAIATTLFQIGGGVGSLLIGQLLDRSGIRALALMLTAAAPLVIWIGNSPTGALLMALVFLCGLCVLGGQIGLNAVCGSFYPTFIRSTGTGWALGVGRIGAVIGPVLGGQLIGLDLSLPTLFLCASVPFVCCGALTLVLGKLVTGKPEAKLPRTASPIAIPIER
jgi:AAHS family 4-hydroxybenzoate transporter-like MFS transporter